MSGIDTLWFGVDENGEIGVFEAGTYGTVPLLEGMESTRDLANNEKYQKQYRGIGRYIVEQGLGKPGNRSSWPVHCYNNHRDDIGNCLFYWESSPEKSLTLSDLPESLINDHFLLRLKDFDFHAHEPFDIYEYTQRCEYRSALYGQIYPEGWGQTHYPILDPDGSWDVKFLDDYSDYGIWFNGRGFLAIDDAGCLAIFRTDRFGALPLNYVDAMPKLPYLFEDNHPFSNACSGIDLSKPPFPDWAARKEYATQKSREQGMAHWLEYPFHISPPRLFGFYHYDASWHYPLPYLRIGVPENPLHIESLSGAFRDWIHPICLPGTRFAEMSRVQPFELFPCSAVSKDMDDESYGWTKPSVWIDAVLEQIHAINNSGVLNCSEDLLLNRARRHCRRVESLKR